MGGCFCLLGTFERGGAGGLVMVTLPLLEACIVLGGGIPCHVMSSYVMYQFHKTVQPLNKRKRQASHLLRTEYPIFYAIQSSPSIIFSEALVTPRSPPLLKAKNGETHPHGLTAHEHA